MIQRSSIKNSITVLVSGGIDSAVLLYWANQRYKKIYPLYIRQGYQWENVELYWLKRLIKEVSFKRKISSLTILKAPLNDVFKNHWSVTGKKVPGFNSTPPSVYLPGRNLFVLSKSAAFCKEIKIHEIAIGSLKGNPFRDGRPAFFKTLEKIIFESLDHPVTIKSPFAKWSKERVLRYGKELPLHLSFSCLNPNGYKHCGRCNKCAERSRAFQSLSKRL